jgi:integrase
VNKLKSHGQERISTNSAKVQEVDIRRPGATQTQNHPKMGSTIRVEPIKSQKDINLIKRLLADNPRDLAIFTLGVNTNLRASDLLAIKVGQVRNIELGGQFSVREKKTAKMRTITINRASHTIIVCLLESMPTARDEDYLFMSRKGGGKITVSYLSQLVKEWCGHINLRGNYGSHSLRKTWGFMMRTVHNVDLPTLMTIFNHSSQRQTLLYLCIQPEEIRDCYMKEV